MKDKILLIITVIFFTINFVKAQTNDSKKIEQVDSKGLLNDIDVIKKNPTINNLLSDKLYIRNMTMDSIIKNPNLYIPPVLYNLARELFAQGKKQDASYWYHLGQLRALYDANLCNDISAKRAPNLMNNEYCPHIIKYSFQNLDSLQTTIYTVCDFVSTNEEKYDHKWINQFGNGEIINPLNEPENKWSLIKMKTIENYKKDFKEIIKQYKKSKKIK